jgi:hypothetical protein
VKDVSAEVLAEAIGQTLAAGASKPRVFLQSAARWNDEKVNPKWRSLDNHLVGSDAEFIAIG